MASLTVYANEPVTRGKVVLHTSLGPLDVELWAKEAPLACRNFVQLGLEGYYDGCIFHRVIKDFMAQTGDPTGTGSGGDSAFGGDFKDEVHGRLRFSHRGLLGMASSGPNTNRSQFFLTLDRCEWLDGKHTIFGKVTGNSIYNLNRINELEVGPGDRPVYPPRILRMEILLEPFDDIVPRAAAPPPRAEAEANRRVKKKEKKNLSLLSFGEEAQEEEGAQQSSKRKGISSHDLLDDPRLSKEYAIDTRHANPPGEKKTPAGRDENKTAAGRAAAADRMRGGVAKGEGAGGEGEGAGCEGAEGDGSAGDFGERMRRQMRDRKASLAQAAAGEAAAGGSAGDETAGGGAAAAARDEYQRLRRELAGGKAVAGESGDEAAAGRKWRGKGAEASDDDGSESDGGGGEGMSALERRRAKYLEKKRASMQLSKKQRQAATLHRLSGFQSALESGAAPVRAHALRFESERREAETASHYDAFDPLKHGADAQRAEAKIKEREKVMLSMKG